MVVAATEHLQITPHRLTDTLREEDRLKSKPKPAAAGENAVSTGCCRSANDGGAVRRRESKTDRGGVVGSRSQVYQPCR